MIRLTNKRVLLGVSGSIAAYKSADMVRRLREAGAEVRAVLTRGGSRFITPLTLQALSGNPVHEDLLDPAAEAAMGHIELARWADTILIAPASADLIARLAHGRADDLLAAVCLASDAPVAVAPAMNRLMWDKPATRENMQVLLSRGIHQFGPAEGVQACGEIGEGRMLEPVQLLDKLAGLFATGVFSGARVLVSAGPTREDIDPVRFISNRSSGKMGYAIAEAATEAGAEVTLVSGPVSLQVPERVNRINVETSQQMHDAIIQNVSACDIFISAAAVADYRPVDPAANKLKKNNRTMELSMERTPDILASITHLPDAPFSVGFAAETEHLLEHAESKLRNKKLDMIAANLVGPGLGFESDENSLEVIWADGRLSLPLYSKSKLARKLISVIAERYHAKNTNENS